VSGRAGIFLGLLFAGAAAAERLPVESSGAADGLGHDHVRCVVRDRHDFLWFCTGAGLARFDGTRFQRFGVAEGLPGARVFAATETADGAIWAATDRGVARLAAGDGVARPRFEEVALARAPEGATVRALLVDTDGTVLAASEAGIDRISTAGATAPSASPFTGCDPLPESIRALARSADGALWIGGADGRVAVFRDGRSNSGGDCREFRVAADGLSVRAFLESRDGSLWIASDAGLARLERGAALEASSLRWFGAADGFASRRARSIHETTDGTLWVGAVGALYRLESDRFSRFTMANGLPDDTVNAFGSDRLNQLWLATDTGGVARLLADGFVTFGRADGLGHEAVRQLELDADGALLVAGEVGGWLARRVGSRFTAIVPPFPSELRERIAASPTWPLIDRRGELWVATVAGLFRFPRPASFEGFGSRSATAKLDRSTGLSGDWAYRVDETASGELWVATERGPEGATLSRISPDRRTIDRYGPADGLPEGGSPESFIGDAEGALWLGWSDGVLLRFVGRRFEPVAAVEGYPLRELAWHSDTLWAATGGAGLHRLESEGGERGWRFVAEPAAGIENADVRGIAFGPSGALALATSAGTLLRSEPRAPFRRFARPDGLGGLEVNSVLFDRDGALWAGTFGGVSRRAPSVQTPRPAPGAIWIRSLDLDGATVPISPLGERRVASRALTAGPHRLRIGWSGLAFAPGEMPRVRYRVVGVDPEWSAPTGENAITLAGLAAGAYRFEAIAATEGGEPGPEPAVFEWSIGQPLWRTPGFAFTLAAVLGAAGFAWHRARLRRALAIADVRARIAAELHDDLSASLTRISIQSEVASRRLAGDVDGARGLLSEIGTDARTLLDSTRDLVWAIDPGDGGGAGVAGFAARLRSFVDGIPDSAERSIRFSVEGELGDEPLGVGERRHLLPLLKEAIHNALRHAEAKRIDVRLEIGSRTLVAEVCDDGRGFDPAVAEVPDAPGRGIRGMRARATGMGATLVIERRPNGGTRIVCRVPRRRGTERGA
jgi:signal transduction histidine kinase/ligand-binding sensor domain-containing protein